MWGEKRNLEMCQPPATIWEQSHGLTEFGRLVQRALHRCHISGAKGSWIQIEPNTFMVKFMTS